MITMTSVRETILVNISTNLRRALERHGLSQSDLAQEGNESSVLISQYVRGTNMPAVDRLARVAAALETSIDNLIERHHEQIFRGGKSQKPGKALVSAG